MEELNQTKKQHYIPQFYLKNFCQDGETIFIYDRKKGEKGEIRHQTTIDIAHENHFYTFRTKQGKKDNLEDFFGQIEGNAATAINNVHTRRVITDEEKENIALFVAFLHTRVPAFKRESEEMTTQASEKIARLMLESTPKEKFKKFFLEKEGREPTEEEIDNIMDFGTNPKRSKFKLVFPKEHWIKTMLMLGVDAAQYFYDMDWIFLFTKEPYAFITSDNPFLLVPPKVYDPFRGVGLLTIGAKKIIPLRSDMCLMMGDLSKDPITKFGEADKIYFKNLNINLMVESERFCFSPDKGKLEKLVKEVKPYNIPKIKRFSID